MKSPEKKSHGQRSWNFGENLNKSVSSLPACLKKNNSIFFSVPHARVRIFLSNKRLIKNQNRATYFAVFKLSMILDTTLIYFPKFLE